MNYIIYFYKMGSFRPANALSLTDLTAKEAENVVYKSEFTIFFHIFISLAAACFAWVFMLQPLMSKSKIAAGIFGIIWFLVLPIIILASESLLDSILSRDNAIFAYLKFISVWVTLLVVFGFIIYYNIYGDSRKIHIIRTIVISGLFLINILEASFDQIINRRIDDKMNESVDMANGILGIMLSIILVVSVFYSNGIGVVSTKNTTFLNFELGTWFILAYSFWNILFRSYIIQNTGTLYFTIVSLFLPLLLHFMNIGNWFENRALTLFFYAITIIGITKSDGRLLPLYNEQGYIEEADSGSPLSSIQGEDWYKVLLLVLTSVCIIGACIEIYMKN